MGAIGRGRLGLRRSGPGREWRDGYDEDHPRRFARSVAVVPVAAVDARPAGLLAGPALACGVCGARAAVLTGIACGVPCRRDCQRASTGRVVADQAVDLVTGALRVGAVMDGSRLAEVHARPAGGRLLERTFEEDLRPIAGLLLVVGCPAAP